MRSGALLRWRHPRPRSQPGEKGAGTRYVGAVRRGALVRASKLAGARDPETGDGKLMRIQIRPALMGLLLAPARNRGGACFLPGAEAA
jgi:hypothetical protein